jgi:hypothetical protein
MKRKGGSRASERRRDLVEMNLLVEDEERGRRRFGFRRTGCWPPFAGLLLLAAAAQLVALHL